MAKEIKTFKTKSEEDTLELGRMIALGLKPGDAISLEGDLGTGKTAFTKGLALGLDITEPITSPTFTLVNTYEGRTTLHHFDVYRVDDPEELYSIGWEEYFSDEAITVVEWGDRIPELLPNDTIHIRLLRGNLEPDNRTVTIERQVI